VLANSHWVDESYLEEALKSNNKVREAMCRTKARARLLCVFLFIYANWTVGETATAQTISALPVESAIGGHSFADLSSIEVSQDRKLVAYVVKDNGRTKPANLGSKVTTGIPMWINGCDIWISNTETGTSQNLTQGNRENWMPKWSPDQRYLAFLSDRDGRGQAKLWVWDVRQNRMEKVSDLQVRADQIEWTRDSQHVLTTVLPQGLSVAAYVTAVQSESSGQESDAEQVHGVTVFTYRPKSPEQSHDKFPSSDPWNLSTSLCDLVSLEVPTGKVSTVVSGQKIAAFAVSPAASSVAYTIPKRFAKAGSNQILFDLMVANFATGKSETVASNLPLVYDGANFSWSPDGSLLAYSTVANQDNDAYVVSAAAGGPHNVTHFPPAGSSPYSQSPPVWGPDGRLYLLREGALWVTSVGQEKAVRRAQVANRRIAYVISHPDNTIWTPDGEKSLLVLTHDEEGKQDGFYSVDLESGESRKLIERRQCYTCGNLRHSFAAPDKGNGVLYISEDAEHAPDLWLSDPSFQNPRRLTHLNPQFDAQKLGAARLIDWLSDDGERLHGALLLPSDYQKGKRYPLVVWAYATGMLSDNLDRFGLGFHGPLNFQLLATRGYAVLLPDSPQHEAMAMIDLVKTVLPGVNAVIDAGIADPNRLAVMGLSNGGYSTLALIAQTKRFRCAVEMDGVVDLVAEYGHMDKFGGASGPSTFEHGQDAMGGPPWEFPQRYIQNSPIFYLDRIETPLLVVHGSEDMIVPPFLSDEVFVGLRRVGREVEYAKYEGEDHSPNYWSNAHQIDLSNRILGWIQGHIGIDGE
jgi:dipeptidyl aminopeptidase/acylaminoacyl peptidase